MKPASRIFWISLFLTLAIFPVLLFLFGPTSAQIRLDCGDLRYCWYGIPLTCHPMPEPYRSKLLALSAKSPAIPAEWITCVTYPLRGSNNPDLMCAGFYAKASAWSNADPTIARFILDDLVTYVKSLNASHGLPSAFVLFLVEYGARGELEVTPDWRSKEEVADYCRRHGYKIPSP